MKQSLLDALTSIYVKHFAQQWPDAFAVAKREMPDYTRLKIFVLKKRIQWNRPHIKEVQEINTMIRLLENRDKQEKIRIDIELIGTEL